MSAVVVVPSGGGSMLAEGKKAQEVNPWPGLRLACVKILQLYCKVFDQPDIFQVAR